MFVHNKQNEIHERYFCRLNDRDIFYVDFVLNPSMPIAFIEVSLGFNIRRYTVAANLMESIEATGVLQERRVGLISLLFLFIKTIDGISSFYLKNYLLDLNGKYMDYYYKTLVCIIDDEYKIFPDYSPFSNTSNFLLFKAGKSILQEEINLKAHIYLLRNNFEKIIAGKTSLQFEYVTYYNSRNNFLYLQRNNNGVLYDVYIMTIKWQIKLFFIRVNP
jgi:hypothetical protein